MMLIAWKRRSIWLPHLLFAHNRSTCSHLRRPLLNKARSISITQPFLPSSTIYIVPHITPYLRFFSCTKNLNCREFTYEFCRLMAAQINICSRLASQVIWLYKLHDKKACLGRQKVENKMLVRQHIYTYIRDHALTRSYYPQWNMNGGLHFCFAFIQQRLKSVRLSAKFLFYLTVR